MAHHVDGGMVRSGACLRRFCTSWNPTCITQITAVENGLKLKPSLSQISPAGFPVWCYCSLLRLSLRLFSGTTARSGQAPETTDGAVIFFL